MPLSNTPCTFNGRMIGYHAARGWLASLLAILCCASLLSGQSIASRPPDQIGPNSRVWFAKPADSAPEAQRNAAPALNAFANLGQDAAAQPQNSGGSRLEEVATGMNFWDGEKWTPSQASFDLAADGFVATHLQYLVNI